MDINIDRIRSEMTNREQWLCWEAAMRDGKETKLPKDPETGDFAQTDDPSTWGSFLNANGKVKAGQMDGVGFVFTEDDNYVGIDLDNCRDPETGEWEDWALDVMQDIGGWIEISPSGTGAHIILKGEIPGDRNRKGDLEMYEDGRFFTITGQLVNENGERLDEDEETPEIKEAQQALDAVYDRFLAEEEESANETDVDVDPDKWGHLDLEDHDSDSPSTHSGGANPDELPAELREIVDTAKSANNGYQFAQLWRGNWEGYYPSHSEGDMAFCDMLAFWFSGDPERMDRVFRASGLMRPKWDDVRYSDGSTYGERTIEKAIASVDDHYDDDYYDDLTDDEGNDTDTTSGDEDINTPDDVETEVNADSDEDDTEDDDDSGGEFSSESADGTESTATSEVDSPDELPDSSETDESETSEEQPGGGSGATTEARSQDRSRGRSRRRESGRKRSQKRRGGIPDDISNSSSETEQSSSGPAADDGDADSSSEGDSRTELDFDSGSNSESVDDDGPADGSMFDKDEFVEDDEDDEDEVELPSRDEAEGIIDEMEEEEESSNSSADSVSSSPESPQGGGSDGGEESKSTPNDERAEDDSQTSERDSSRGSNDSSVDLDDTDQFQTKTEKRLEHLEQQLSQLVDELDTAKAELRHDVELEDDKLERVYYELQQYEKIVDKRENQVETMYQLLVLICHVQPEPIFDRIENVLVSEDGIPSENIFNESVEEIIEHYHEDTSMMDSGEGGAPGEQSTGERGISEGSGVSNRRDAPGRASNGRTRADGEGDVSVNGDSEGGENGDEGDSFWSQYF